MKGSNFKLLSNIFRSAWLINPEFAHSQVPIIISLMNGQPNAGAWSEDEGVKKPELTAIYMNEAGEMARHYGSISNAPAGSVAIINVKGPIMKDDFCGDPGTDSLGEQMKLADSNPNIVGAVHLHDSPGGTVSGTEKCAAIVAATKKPTVGFVDDLSASASYWIISGTNHIMMSTRTSEVGSIGTMIGFADVRPYWEKQGVKFHDILATKSKDKNKDYYEMLDSKYDNIIKNSLDPLNEIFLAAVKKNRPNVSEEALTGKMYFPEQAIKVGLADSIGTLEDAVAKVIELADTGAGASGAGGGATKMHIGMPFDYAAEEILNQVQDDDSNKSNLNKTENEVNLIKSKLDKAVAKLAASVKAGEDISAEDIQPVIEELSAAGLEGFVMDTDEGRNAITEQNATLTARVAELEGELATANTDLKASEKEVTRLGLLAGAKHTNPNKDGGDTSQGGGDENAEGMDPDAPHNKEALEEIKNLG